MTKQNKNKIILFAISLTFAVFAKAETATISAPTVGVKPAAPPAFSAKISESYYNFQGTRQQQDGRYSFGDASLRMEIFSMNYIVNPSWTLMVMGSHLDNFVVTKIGGVDYQDRTQGFGDTVVSALSTVTASGSFLMMADTGISLPTGSIQNKNKLAPTADYAYNMQMGSGTVDAVLGITPMYFFPKVQVGGHLMTILRTAVLNENGYHLGNQYKAEAWVDYPTSTGFTPRLVGYYKYKDAISGYDVTYEGTPSSPRRLFTDFYHHSQINWDVSAAVKYKKALSVLPVALEAEVGVPVAQESQNSDHVMVSTEYFGNLSVSGTF